MVALKRKAMVALTLRVPTWALMSCLGLCTACGGGEDSNGNSSTSDGPSTSTSATGAGTTTAGGDSTTGGTSTTGGSSTGQGALQAEFDTLWAENGYVDAALEHCDGVDARGRIQGDGFARGNGVDMPSLEVEQDGSARYVAQGFDDDVLTVELEALVAFGEYAEVSGTFYLNAATVGGPENYQTYCFEGILRRTAQVPEVGPPCSLLIAPTFGSLSGGACVGEAGDYFSAMLAEELP